MDDVPEVADLLLTMPDAERQRVLEHARQIAEYYPKAAVSSALLFAIAARSFELDCELAALRFING